MSDLLHAMHADDCRLSCTAQVTGDVLIYIRKKAGRISRSSVKAAGERVIDIDPAVRQFYVQVEDAAPSEHRRTGGVYKTHWNKSRPHRPDHRSTRVAQTSAPLRQAKRATTVIVRNDREVIDVRPGFKAKKVSTAGGDIGSTTVAAYLVRPPHGRGAGHRVRDEPADQLWRRPDEPCPYVAMKRRRHREDARRHHQGAQQAGGGRRRTPYGLKIRDIHELVVAGNTTMMHLFWASTRTGRDAPALANRDAMGHQGARSGLRLHPAGNVHALPSEAGHVGADNGGAPCRGAAPPGSGRTDCRRRHQRRDRAGNREWLGERPSPTAGLRGRADQRGMRAASGAIERVRIDRDSGCANFRRHRRRALVE